MSERLWSCMASAVRMLTPNSSSTAAMKPRLLTESHPGVVLCDASAPTLSSEEPMTSANKEESLASSASGDMALEVYVCAYGPSIAREREEGCASLENSLWTCSLT